MSIDSSVSAPLVSLSDATVTVSSTGRALLHIPRLTISRGERIVVTGASGSGKSLLFSTLTGRWATGLSFAGERTAHLDRIGFVPQRGLDALHPLSPLARQLRRVTGCDADRVTHVLEAAGLTDPELHRRRPTELSGGQAQRAAVALAVLTDAPLILADEPTSALDHDTRDALLSLFDDLVDRTHTLIVSTHDPVVARTLATRHLHVEQGTVSEHPLPQKPSGASTIGHAA